MGLDSFSVVECLLLAFACVLTPTLAVPPPGQLFDLSKFDLQLPTCTPPKCTSGIDTVSSAELKTYTSQYFYTDPSTQAMTFWCPIDGKHTGGSVYPRSELRENQNLAWNNDGKGDWTFIGVHELNVTMQVLQEPTTGAITIGQAHGADINTTSISGSCSIISEFEWQKGKLVNNMRTAPSGNACGGVTQTFPGTYALGEIFSYSIRVSGKDVSLWTSKGGWSKTYTYSWWPTSGPEIYWLYFKAGDYVQDSGSSSTIGGKVAISAIKTNHSPNAW